jgi:Glycosyl transferase family 2
MKLVSVTIAKNEADIVESFVRHHTALFDHVVVVDHDSVDGTREILDELVAEGLPLTVLDDFSLSFSQSSKTTSLAREAFRGFDADYVFPLDADEFVRCESRAALDAALTEMPKGQIAHMDWQNHIVSPFDDIEEIDPVRRIAHRAATESMPEHKVVLPRAFALNEALKLSQGNHAVYQRGKRRGEDSVALRGVSLQHFPIRGEEHVQLKALLGWLSVRLQNPAIYSGAEKAGPPAVALSWHRRELFREVCRDPAFTTERLQQLTWQLYVAKTREDVCSIDVKLANDPLHVAYTLRYTKARTGSALVGLARWGDRLLTQLATAA